MIDDPRAIDVLIQRHARTGSSLECHQETRAALTTIADRQRADALLAGIAVNNDGAHEDAKAALQSPADAATPEAQFSIGLRWDVAEEAEDWYRYAADAGHAYAQYNLGVPLQEAGCT